MTDYPSFRQYLTQTDVQMPSTWQVHDAETQAPASGRLKTRRLVGVNDSLPIHLSSPKSLPIVLSFLPLFWCSKDLCHEFPQCSQTCSRPSGQGPSVQPPSLAHLKQTWPWQLPRPALTRLPELLPRFRTASKSPSSPSLCLRFDPLGLLVRFALSSKRPSPSSPAAAIA